MKIKSLLKKSLLWRLLGLVVLIAVLLFAGIYLILNHSNSNKQINLKPSQYTTELEQAKKELQRHPNNLQDITNVADLTYEKSPAQAKPYYIQALNELKKTDNPDVGGKSTELYWVAAGIAERAGETTQAIKYYQYVITTANPSNSYEQSLAAQSKAAIKRLQ